MVWACTRCGTNNKDAVRECIVCGEAKPERTEPSQRKKLAPEEPTSFHKETGVSAEDGGFHKGGVVSEEPEKPKKSDLESQIEEAREKYGSLFKR